NDDQWAGDSKNGPSESDQQTYDGPPGMEPDGIIESNWDVVSSKVFQTKLKSSSSLKGVVMIITFVVVRSLLLAN
ncbi:unnamed protein product, partial [Heterotrigona itama]